MGLWNLDLRPVNANTYKFKKKLNPKRYLMLEDAYYQDLGKLEKSEETFEN